MKDGPMKDLIPVLYLTVIVCFAVIALVLTDMATRDMIEENKQAEINENLEVLFPEIKGDAVEKNEIYFVYNDVNQTNGTIAGYAFVAEASGYGGTIEILIGLEAFAEQDDGAGGMEIVPVENVTDPNDVVLRGITIVSHTETPGLGAKITEEDFTKHFTSLTIGDCTLDKDGGDIDTISGATISSRAVTEEVKKASLQKVKAIKKMADSGGA